MAITIQTCEVCDTPLSDDLDPLELCACSQRQSPEFYRGFGEVWTNGVYSVVCVGEMRIYYVDEKTNQEHTLTYPDDLASVGIQTDKDLAEQHDRGEDKFYEGMNPWFEVVSEVYAGFYSDPIHELDEAIKYALDLTKQDKK
jgi:hypothetical protein